MSWQDEYNKELEKRKERMNIIMSNTDYINWLIDFMKDKKIFHDEDWDYSLQKLDKYNQERVNELGLFFEGIFHYARSNNIDSFFRPLGECFYIKMNDNYFEIGYITGQGTMFYCKKVSPDEDFIDFIDIINNKDKVMKKTL